MLDSLAESDRSVLKAELHRKMLSACAGKLTYGPTSRDDVFVMARRDNVLELRLSSYAEYPLDDPLNGDPQLRHTRLYFSEPEPCPDQLLALSLRSKCPGPLGVEEQNGHVDEAYSRLSLYEIWLLS